MSKPNRAAKKALLAQYNAADEAWTNAVRSGKDARDLYAVREDFAAKCAAAGLFGSSPVDSLTR